MTRYTIRPLHVAPQNDCACMLKECFSYIWQSKPSGNIQGSQNQAANLNRPKPNYPYINTRRPGQQGYSSNGPRPCLQTDDQIITPRILVEIQLRIQIYVQKIFYTADTCHTTINSTDVKRHTNSKFILKTL